MATFSSHLPLPVGVARPLIVKVWVSLILGSAPGWGIVTPLMFIFAQAELTIPKKNRIVKAIKAIRLFFFSAMSAMRTP